VTRWAQVSPMLMKTPIELRDDPPHRKWNAGICVMVISTAVIALFIAVFATDGLNAVAAQDAFVLLGP
jgi:hypothetical protein